MLHLILLYCLFANPLISLSKTLLCVLKNYEPYKVQSKAHNLLTSGTICMKHVKVI